MASFEPLNVLLGAVVALIVRELVEARKAKRRLLARHDDLLRVMKQELEDMRETAAINLINQLWDRDEAKFNHRHLLHWETKIDPLSPLPERLEDLMRREGPPELLGNSELMSLLSSAVSLVKHIGLMDRQRMRYVTALYRPNPLYLHDQAETAERIERWEELLLKMHIDLLRNTVLGAAMIEVIEADRRDMRRLRSRVRSVYEPDKFDWEALDQLIREVDSFELTAMSGSGVGGSNSRWTVLKHFGLASDESGWSVTPRGRLVRGSGSKYWHRPRSPDPPQRRVQYENFDPWDFV
mgnify:CR=1 FL=1